MTDDDLDKLEITLFSEGVYQRYGYDFRDYARASLKRRVAHCLRQENLKTVSALQDRVLHEPAAMQRFIQALTVDTTTIFRDPGFYTAFRAKVAPFLRTLPFIRVWHAGCATGEEVYSMAILLTEEGLYDKSRLYATDLNEASLEKAKAGIYSLDALRVHTANYHKAGGKEEFSRYYTSRYKNAIFVADLKRNLVFSSHNLACDTSFNEFHAILCRNVMIYFNQSLQERVHRLLFTSLACPGILCLGAKEVVRFSPFAACYEEMDGVQRIYLRAK